MGLLLNALKDISARSVPVVAPPNVDPTSTFAAHLLIPNDFPNESPDAVEAVEEVFDDCKLDEAVGRSFDETACDAAPWEPPALRIVTKKSPNKTSLSPAPSIAPTLSPIASLRDKIIMHLATKPVNEGRSIAFCTVDELPERTRLIANIARSFADLASRPVLAIDASFSNRGLARRFGASSRGALPFKLARQASSNADTIAPADVSGLDSVSLANIFLDAGSASVKEINFRIRCWAQKYGWLVIDAGLADGEHISDICRTADVVYLIVCLRHTLHSSAVEAVDRLRRYGVLPAGIVAIGDRG